MSSNKNRLNFPRANNKIPKFKIVKSLLDEMVDGNEYSSIITCMPAEGIDLGVELKRAIKEISIIRNRSVVCYLANVINQNIKTPTGINYSDDLPFEEMISNIPDGEKSIDVVLVTPGGSAEQVDKFVTCLRSRFENVGFILPYMALSAGTIFCLSGDELIMDSRAYIGPIDPQVASRDGRYVPAQSINTLINEIQDRGEKALANGNNPNWSDIQILDGLDGKEIGNAINASKLSIELATDYLTNYKFKNWNKHSKTGKPVTQDDKIKRANKIAADLCDSSIWKTHSRGITRDMAYSKCRLEIKRPESIIGLNRAIRRFWALTYWMFEKGPVAKIFISENYSVFRNDNVIIQRI